MRDEGGLWRLSSLGKGLGPPGTVFWGVKKTKSQSKQGPNLSQAVHRFRHGHGLTLRCGEDRNKGNASIPILAQFEMGSGSPRTLFLC